MTNFIVTTGIVNANADGITLTAVNDTLFVGKDATVGSTARLGVGVGLLAAYQEVTVAGHVIGDDGVYMSGVFSDVTILAGGSVSGARTAIVLTQTGTVSNAGTLSGGILGFEDAVITNTGFMTDRFSTITVNGAGTVRNSGTISTRNDATFDAIDIQGVAKISNFGDIFGSIQTNNAADRIINRGLIDGAVAVGLANDLVDTAGGRIEGVVNLGGGDDRFIGGGFSDVVRGDTGRDDIGAGGGDDYIIAVAGDGSDEIDGGTGVDVYEGRGLTTSLRINLTTGVARSGGAADLLASIEWAFGGDGADVVTGTAAANRLRGGDGADALTGLSGADALFGENGDDQLFGGDGNDRLYGRDGVDVLDGGNGNDWLSGSYDRDRMRGGAGDDTFVFEDFEEFIPVNGTGLDRITDFVRGDDVIDLSGIDANPVVAGEQAFRFTGLSAVDARGEVSYRFVGQTTVISIGYNTPAPYDVLVLDGRLALITADFVL